MKDTEVKGGYHYVDGELYHSCDKCGRARKGTLAGYTKENGYTAVYVLGKKIMAHRLIWEHFNGPIPTGFYIDHINGNRSDNRIENLRLATPAQNSQNRLGAVSTNATGVRGVWYRKEINKYRVQVCKEGKKYEFGYYSDLELAELIAEEARHKYFGEFA